MHDDDDGWFVQCPGHHHHHHETRIWRYIVVSYTYNHYVDTMDFLFFSYQENENAKKNLQVLWYVCMYILVFIPPFSGNNFRPWSNWRGVLSCCCYIHNNVLFNFEWHIIAIHIPVYFSIYLDIWWLNLQVVFQVIIHFKRWIYIKSLATAILFYKICPRILHFELIDGASLGLYSIFKNAF